MTPRGEVGAGALRVRVPCSTSNLGAGFDTVGLALNRFLEVTYSPAATPLRVTRAGTLAALDVPEGEDTLLRVLRHALAAAGAPEPTGLLHATSDIPIGRGLGSSAAAAVAGCLLARALTDAGMDDDAVFRAAAESDGHPDNAAPAVFGGLVAVARDAANAPCVLCSPVSDDIGWGYAAPVRGMPTPEARAALPRHVPHELAARALGRLAALLGGLAGADPELLRIGFTDELHVPHRLLLIPGAKQAHAAGIEAGAWAVTISGAGSGLIAACAPRDADDVAAAMAQAFGQAGGADGVVAFPLRVEDEGARVFVEEGEWNERG